ncbi:MAG: hypothetical protein J2P36_12320 [Ktedonobacteraceae bacterium]|nr:hypothetical protein [Ktedonobacteraceae bacterium]
MDAKEFERRIQALLDESSGYVMTGNVIDPINRDILEKDIQFYMLAFGVKYVDLCHEFARTWRDGLKSAGTA